MTRWNYETAWFELHWPRPVEAKSLAWLLRRLASDRVLAPLAFASVGQSGGVRFFVGTQPHRATALRHLLTSQLPDLVAQEVQHDEAATLVGVGADTSAVAVRFRSDTLPLDTAQTEAIAGAVLSALASAKNDETITLRAILWHGLSPSFTATPEPWWPNAWRAVLGLPEVKPSPQVARSSSTKAAQAGFTTSLTIAVQAATPGRREHLATGLLAALRSAQTAGVRLDWRHISDRRFSRLWHLPLWSDRDQSRLTTDEIPALLGWPIGDQDLPGLPPTHPKLPPLPKINFVKPDDPKARVFATSDAPATSGQPVALPTKDNLTHLSIVAPTGAGKSTLLHHLIRGDMAGGHGVVVVDPKGDLVESVLTTVPRSRLDDVVVLDLTDQEKPVGFNPLRIAPGQPSEVVAESVVSVFAELWPETGIRTLDVLSAAVFTLTGLNAVQVARDGKNVATLLDVPRLLTDQTFRAKIIGQVDDDNLTGFWEGFAALSTAQAAETIAPVMRRLRQFLARRSLRGVLGQPEPLFDLGQVFAPSGSGAAPKILLVPLNKATIGEQTARMFGALLVTSVWHQTLRRSMVSAQRRTPVSVVLDEAPDLLRLPLSLGDALAQARGYGVGFTLAAQFRAQWPTTLREAVDANTLSKICFRLPTADAKAMATVSGGQISTDDFTTLAQRQIYASLARDGHPGDWFSARTLPPPAATTSPRDLRQASRQRYGQAPASKTATTVPEVDEVLGRKRAS